MNKDEQQQERERQAKLLGKLATRLPWIVVIVTLLTAIATLFEIYFKHL